jgi:hypothetical protein
MNSVVRHTSAFAMALGVLANVMACSEPGVPTPPPPPGMGRATGNLPVAVGSNDIAARSYSSPLSIADAERILSMTQVFHIAGSSPVRQIQAFNVVLDQRDAVERFRRIANDSSTAGRLYALCGLLLCSKTEGTALARSLSLAPGQVTVLDIDWAFDIPVERAIDLIFERRLADTFRQQRDTTYHY